MNENLREAAVVHSRTVRDKNAEIRRLEIANAELVKRCAEYERKYVIVSTLMRRFARYRSLERWSKLVYSSNTDGTKMPRERSMAEHDRMAKALLVNKPWEVVTDL